MPRLPAPPDPYHDLEVDRDATPAQVRRAHRQLAKSLHPDTGERTPAEVARFLRVQEAYLLLRDPARRAAYDLAHPVRATRAAVTGVERPTVRVRRVRTEPAAPAESPASPDVGDDAAPSMWPSPTGEDFEAFARASVTAWSSAARAYFRRRAEQHHREHPELASDRPPRPHS